MFVAWSGDVEPADPGSLLDELLGLGAEAEPA
jgi:hypothetical protein